jgi:hypothetical protein
MWAAKTIAVQTKTTQCQNIAACNVLIKLEELVTMSMLLESYPSVALPTPIG